MRAESAPRARPADASSSNTSEYLAGKVSVSLFLMESTSGSSEDWDATQEGQVYAEAIEAVQAVAQLYPGSERQFVLHARYGGTDPRVRVACEPIAHAARSNDGSGSHEDAWTRTILAGFGSTANDMWTASRNFADTVRGADRTDRALNVFVAHSRADADGVFPDGRFGYAWLGGPHIVKTYDNDGWGIDRSNEVLRPEMHHSFFALDEYSSSNGSCTATSGYFAAPNDDCQRTCLRNVPCVLVANSNSSCAATHAQVATTDTDDDGTADILETAPAVAATVSVAPGNGTPAWITGTPTVGIPPNQNPYYRGSGNAISCSRSPASSTASTAIRGRRRASPRATVSSTPTRRGTRST